jgi:hypothetical protein
MVLLVQLSMVVAVLALPEADTASLALSNFGMNHIERRLIVCCGCFVRFYSLCANGVAKGQTSDGPPPQDELLSVV